MMKNHYGTWLLTVLTVLSFCVMGCGSSTGSEKKEIVIQINNSKISLAEFNDLIKFEAYADPEMELTTDTRDQFINYLVRKELLRSEEHTSELQSHC